MICKNCGSTIEGEATFCPECGAPIAKSVPAPTTEPAPQDSISLAEDPTAEEPMKPRSGKKRFWLIGIAALCVLAVALFLILGAINKRNYEAASALFEGGGYAAAAQAFMALGNYKDSADRAALSADWANYTNACNMIEIFSHDDAVEAKQVFLSLGQFEDAPEKAIFCQNSLDFEAACALESAGDYAGALTAFEELGSFSSAAEHARYCSDTLDYNAASELIGAGDYAAAAEKLAAPAENAYEDATDQLEYCNNKVAYQGAEQALASGKNYTAYVEFLELGSFEDSATRAKSCVLEEPKSGELYRNENYNAKQVKFKVVNSYNKATYIKLYSNNGDLVCTFYIQANKNATVHVPAGTYTINRAFGTQWFGLEDMFGDDGTYYRQLIGNSYEFTMKNNYIYTLSTGSGGTPVVDNTTAREGF